VNSLGRLPGKVLYRLRDKSREWRAERRGAARDRELLPTLSGRNDLRINVGSSSSHLDGWLNCDLQRDPEGLCIRMDATQRWPFDSSSAEAINSEHFIEHVDIDHARGYFREAFRVLRPQGVIRTSTPDLEGLCRSYIERDPTLLELHRQHGYVATGMGDLLNNYIYMWGHCHMYDFEKLANLLHEAGFQQTERVPYGESSHEVLQGIDRHEMGALRHLVVTVDAVKP
jgi:predicted SAM-dependent methyltransferase